MRKHKMHRNNYGLIAINRKLDRIQTDLSVIKSMLAFKRSDSDAAISRINEAAELIREMSEKERDHIHSLYGK